MPLLCGLSQAKLSKLERGQDLAMRLFEPRYTLMIQRCLTSADSRFGIVFDEAIRPGAVGRVASIMCEQQRPDGSFDVLIQAGEAFTVSPSTWHIPVPGRPNAPPLLCTRVHLPAAAPAAMVAATVADRATAGATAQTVRIAGGITVLAPLLRRLSARLRTCRAHLNRPPPASEALGDSPL